MFYLFIYFNTKQALTQNSIVNENIKFNRAREKKIIDIKNGNKNKTKYIQIYL